ncbi:hypothetical protein QTN25_008125 [Entamoeba marina]
MLLVYFFFFLSAYSATWCEYNIVNGLITYENDEDDTTCKRVGWDLHQYWEAKIDTFTFGNSCCSLKEMTLLFYNGDTWTKCVNFTSGNSGSILSSIKTINTYSKMKQVINTKNMKNGVSFYLGCFETDYYSYKRVDKSSSSDYYCRSSVDNGAKTYVEIYSSDLILYGDDRLEKPDDMDQQLYDIIDKAWKQDVSERIDIDETIELLESL